MAAVNRAWSRQRVINDCACWPDEAERARWIHLFADEHMEKTWARETAYQNAGVHGRYFLFTGETEVTPRGLKAFIALCEMGAMTRRCCASRRARRSGERPRLPTPSISIGSAGA